MRKYNEFSSLWRAAIFHKPFYQDVAQNWRGIGLLYLLLLVILTWLPVLLQANRGMSEFINHDAAAALKDFPTIHLTKGVASSDVAQPYIFKGDRGEALFVFDTTGTTKLPSDVGAKMLMTDTELIQENPPGNVQRHPLNQFPDTTIDQAWLLSWFGLVRNSIVPGGLVGAAIYRLGLTLLLALLGLAFNAAFRGGLSFAALLRLAVVSMTGPMILGGGSMLLSLPSPCCAIWFLLLALTFGYFIFGIKAAAQVIPRRAPNYSAYAAPRPGSLTPPPLPPQKPGSDFFP